MDLFGGAHQKCFTPLARTSAIALYPVTSDKSAFHRVNKNLSVKQTSIACGLFVCS
jgi:hypothetical protein